MITDKLFTAVLYVTLPPKGGGVIFFRGGLANADLGLFVPHAALYPLILMSVGSLFQDGRFIC